MVRKRGQEILPMVVVAVYEVRNARRAQVLERGRVLVRASFVCEIACQQNKVRSTIENM